MRVAAISPAWLTRKALSKNSRWVLLRMYRGLEVPFVPVVAYRRWERTAVGARKSRRIGDDRWAERRACAVRHLRSVGIDDIVRILVMAASCSKYWISEVRWTGLPLPRAWVLARGRHEPTAKANLRHTTPSSLRYPHLYYRIRLYRSPIIVGEFSDIEILHLVDSLPRGYSRIFAPPGQEPLDCRFRIWSADGKAWSLSLYTWTIPSC